MKKIFNLLAVISAVLTGFSFSACGGANVSLNENSIVKESIVIGGYEWGAAVSGLVLEFNDYVSGIDKDTFSVKTINSERTVTDAYLSDETGNKTEEKSKFVTLEMSVRYQQASPFGNKTLGGTGIYSVMLSDWREDYNVTLSVNKNFKIGAANCNSGEYIYNAINNRIIPQTQSWEKNEYTYSGENKEIKFSYGSWTPEGAETDSGKNPLVIWLHGLSEGGTDIDINLLGNEITALTTENDTNIQHYFKKDGLAGAYVLAVQCPTMWMDEEGNASYGNNFRYTDTLRSYYTEALFAAIESYVDGNSDIDTNRIYLGGCSNGGFMTMNLMFSHGDYFSAYYPICEAYYSLAVNDAMINAVKDYNIWFLQSVNDATVVPFGSAVPTYYRLLNAGAENVHFTLKPEVKGIDDEKATYDGHWSWICAFNDDVNTRFDDSKVREDYANIQVNDKGVITNRTQIYVKPENCTVKENMWDWLSKQSKPV